MTELQRYLAEEIAEDHVDGIISRREAIRRLGLLGLSVTAASSLIATYAAEEAAAAMRAEKPPKPAKPPKDKDKNPVEPATEAITFVGPKGRRLMGAWAEAESARGGVLVIHENRGLNDHIRSVAARFAASGYSALAIDLLSEEGGTDSFSDPAQATAALGQVPPERFDADMRFGVTEVKRRIRGGDVAAVGFCFGGGMVWRLLEAGEQQLRAAVPFYGPLPAQPPPPLPPRVPDFSGSKKAAVLAIYAELDMRITNMRGVAAAALTAAGLVHELVTFPGVNHAFFNDTGARYDAAAAAEAYELVLAWFAEHLDR
jgi:carboxymethylenebutenolidase